mmetsp:Transcript_4/g.16  ORF Transcript_4/g.16 Transcript_4/m.16 type:complete len:117 (+) Transcript_4:415-765(+)
MFAETASAYLNKVPHNLLRDKTHERPWIPGPSTGVVSKRVENSKSKSDVKRLPVTASKSVKTLSPDQVSEVEKLVNECNLTLDSIESRSKSFSEDITVQNAIFKSQLARVKESLVN